MMQHIAPMQTDIAAKSSTQSGAKASTDIGFDVEKQWLGNDAQQQGSSNNSEFGRVLEHHRRDNTGANSRVDVSKESQHTKVTSSDTEKKDFNADEVINTDAKEEAQPISETVETALQPKTTTSMQPSTSVDISADESTEELAINWVALVEEVKSLTKQSEFEEAKLVDSQQPIWDGEIAEMIAIDDPVVKDKKSAIGPIYTIELPAIKVDALLSGDPEQAAEVADSILAQLQSIPSIEVTDGKGTKTIPNDLYIKPISDADLNAVIDPILETVSTNGDAENNELKAVAPSLLSALVSDLVAKSNDKPSNAAKDKSSDDGLAASISSASTAEIKINTEADATLTAMDELVDISAASIAATSKPESVVVIEKPVANVTEIGGRLEAESIATESNKSAGPETTQLTSSIAVNTSDKNALVVLTKLDTEQQKLVVDDIANRINKLSAGAMTSGQQQGFIAALQAGVEEYSKQMQQGREPGISLKAIIAEALASVEVTADKVSSQALSQVTSELSQTLNLTDALRSGLNDISTNTIQVARAEAASVDVSNQVETTKQSQLTQSLDKPINILRTDGQNQFAEKIRWIVNARNSFAEIRLDPPDLGSVQVKVSAAGETASVNFVVQSQQAKDVLDQAAPRLRDMLAQQGIELGQSSVQQESQQQQEQGQDGQFAQNRRDDGLDEVAASVIEQRATGGVAGGIDFYA